MSRTMVGQDRPRWLTLGEAARFLGVDVTTLRGWADAGKVPAFRTPGGHRRFDPAHLEALVQAGAALPAGQSPAPGSRAIAPREGLTAPPWYSGLDAPPPAGQRAQRC